MARSRSARLQELIHRRDKVLSVLHPPSAAHARIMEQAGCEALFVGTGGVVGAYTGLADVGTATMTECVTIAGWIADSVSIPVMIDGDTGHGGIMAVRRLIRDSIRAGLAGIRIDDQPIEGKRKTQNAGIDVVPLDQAIARYRAAVDMKNELDPDFVVMAQCYARDATGGTLDDTIAPHEGLSRGGRGRLGAVRIAAFGGRDQGGARRDRRPVLVHARQARALSRSRRASRARGQHRLVSRLQPCRDLGGAVGFHDRFPGARDKGVGRFRRRAGRTVPTRRPEVPPDGEGDAKQQELERKYFGDRQGGG